VSTGNDLMRKRKKGAPNGRGETIRGGGGKTYSGGRTDYRIKFPKRGGVPLAEKERKKENMISGLEKNRSGKALNSIRGVPKKHKKGSGQVNL